MKNTKQTRTALAALGLSLARGMQPRAELLDRVGRDGGGIEVRALVVAALALERQG